jgi:hypothetical protein
MSNKDISEYYLTAHTWKEKPHFMCNENEPEKCAVPLYIYKVYFHNILL